MNEAQHIKIVETTLQKWLQEEDSGYVRRLAEAIVVRVQARIEMELEDREQGVVADLDAIKNIKLSSAENRGTEQAAVDHHPLPPPPVSMEASLIIDPASKMAVDVVRAKPKQPLRLPTNRKLVESQLSPEKLRDFLEKSTQAVISVEVEGRDKPVSLYRNIQLQLGCDTVRLSYGPSDLAQPIPSTVNLDGTQVDPLSVDTPVSVVIECTDELPNVAAKMEDIQSQARVMYRPKPEHIDSYTPRKTGSLTFRLADPRKKNDPNADPHAETDVFVDSKGREY